MSTAHARAADFLESLEEDYGMGEKSLVEVIDLAFDAGYRESFVKTALDTALGIDPSDPEQQHAGNLVNGTTNLISLLWKSQRDQGLTDEAVREKMEGYTIPTASQDYTYMDIHMYALALGVNIRYEVEKFYPREKM